jgi:transposase
MPVKKLAEDMLCDHYNGLSIREIAVKRNCSPTTVHRYLSSLDQYKQSFGNKRPFNLKRAVELRSQHLSYKKIAEKMGNVGVSTVWRHLVKYEKEQGVIYDR